jgi:hypothetical protein
MKSGAKQGRASEERKSHSFEHRRTLYCFVVERPISAFARNQLRSKPHRFGKQKQPADSPRRQFRAVSSGTVYFQ